jgi:hypothetical protein
MAIKRNDLAEPQWLYGDYAIRDKENLFSEDLWKRTINWHLLLEHVKKTENACQLINQYIYPSRLFSAYIDILEANLYILRDIFYYETGAIKTPDTKATWFAQATHALRFWCLDWYKEMESLYEGLHRIENHLIMCLRRTQLSEIAYGVFKKSRLAKSFVPTPTDHRYNIFNDHAYDYACDAYREAETDKDALIDRIANMVNILEDHQAVLFFLIHDFTVSTLSFESLITMFRQSGRGESFIRPWRRDFTGSRDSLIIKMEKDPELGPWVNRYTHLREEYIEHTAKQLFCDEYGNAKNKEEVLNTDNWIRFLIIASVLQEYDEQHSAVAAKPDKDEAADAAKDDAADSKPNEKNTANAAMTEEERTLRMKLSLYFRDDDVIDRFLDHARQLKKDKEITTLVQNNHNRKLCLNISKGLWRVLHDANIYKSSYSNWNAHLKKNKDQLD